MKTGWQKSNEDAQVINSLSIRLNAYVDENARLDREQKIYGEDELQTVDPDEGGAWFCARQEAMGLPLPTWVARNG